MLRKFTKKLQQLMSKFHVQLIEFTQKKIWEKIVETCKTDTQSKE